MPKTETTFWSGLHTIGGNIAEIRYHHARVIFDFGLPFNPADALLANTQGRTEKRVADMLKLNMLPAIDGLYTAKDLQAGNLALQPAEQSPIETAVFISHLHLDHMGAIDTLSPDIPLYMSEQAKALYVELLKIGEKPFKDPDQILTFQFKQPIQIGAISVTAFETDHDVIGSCSLLIETPDKRICYSGDLRMHGQHRERNERWITTMATKNIDYLLIEGTSFHPEETQSDDEREKSEQSEKDVPFIVADILQQTTGLAFFNIYHRNLDRLANMIEASKHAGRKIVFEIETAQIVSTFVPDATFFVLAPENHDKARPSWVEELLKTYDQVSIEQINEQPTTYLVQNSFDRLFSLFDFNVEQSCYIHSNGTPLGVFDPAFASLLTFLSQIGVRYESVQISGHATKDAILAIIDAIKPTIMIPWHSLYPELIIPRDPSQTIFIPEAKKTY